MTIKELLIEGTGLLGSSPPGEGPPPSFIDTPALDVALLLAELLQCRREDLILRENEIAGEETQKNFFAYIDRRKSGECVAYILGRREFRGLDFIVNPHVLVPRPDTEILVEAALEYIDSAGGKPPSLLDLCTGSGAIAISLKKERPHLSVTASDISLEALDIAKENAAKLFKPPVGESRPEVMLIQSDLFKKIPGKFNIIVSNPPYIKTDDLPSLAPEVRREPALALDGGEDGLELIKKIVAKAQGHLLPGGRLFLEADPGQMGAIRSLLSGHGYVDINVHKDLAGRERVISAGC